MIYFLSGIWSTSALISDSKISLPSERNQGSCLRQDTARINLEHLVMPEATNKLEDHVKRT